jgi:uncharacterized protein (TIGR02246 family)
MKTLAISFAYLILSNTTDAQTAQMVRDAQNIQTVLTEMAKAWNSHDVRNFSALFSEDADFMDAAGISARGRKEIEESQEKLFAGRFRNSPLKIADPKIRFITVDIASVDASWEISAVVDTDEKLVPLRKGLFHLIMTKGDDKWYITVMHEMNLAVAE